MTEAQRKAKAKYMKKVKQINLRFYPSEQGLYDKAKKLGSRGIKKLIGEKHDSNNGNE